MKRRKVIAPRGSFGCFPKPCRKHPNASLTLCGCCTNGCLCDAHRKKFTAEAGRCATPNCGHTRVRHRGVVPQWCRDCMCDAFWVADKAASKCCDGTVKTTEVNSPPVVIGPDTTISLGGISEYIHEPDCPQRIAPHWEIRRRAEWLLSCSDDAGIHWPEKQNLARNVLQLLDEIERLDSSPNGELDDDGVERDLDGSGGVKP